MSIAFVQNVTTWLGHTSATSGSFTPSAGDCILIAGCDDSNYPETLTISGSSGSYLVLTPPGTFDDDFGDTWQLAYQNGAAAVSQTVTVATSGSGDTLINFGGDYSGVASVSATENAQAQPGTGAGAIVGVSVNVPTGALLVALCVDVTGGASPTAVPTAVGASATRISGDIDNCGYLWAEWAGAGANIQPAFTSTAGATDYFTVVQWLLLPIQNLLGQVLT
jgi:hypothetical protein